MPNNRIRNAISGKIVPNNLTKGYRWDKNKKIKKQFLEFHYACTIEANLQVYCSKKNSTSSNFTKVNCF